MRLRADSLYVCRCYSFRTFRSPLSLVACIKIKHTSNKPQDTVEFLVLPRRQPPAQPSANIFCCILSPKMIRVVPARWNTEELSWEHRFLLGEILLRQYRRSRGTHPFAHQRSGTPGSRCCGFLKIRSLLLFSLFSRFAQ